MRDESIVVAAELTGVLRHLCFFCKSRHITKDTIKKCAHRFVREVFGDQVISTGSNLPSPNWVAMAKLGLMEEAGRYEGLRTDAHSHSNWEPNWQDFVTCENVDEAFAIAKSRLAVWRDESFVQYSQAVNAKHRCQTEFDALLNPDTTAMVKKPRRIHVEKTIPTTAVPLGLIVEGRSVHPYEALAFYRLGWPDCPQGTLVDVDLNTNKVVMSTTQWNGSTSVLSFHVVQFQDNFKVSKRKLAALKPVEDC